MFFFTHRRSDEKWTPWIALFGDMGSDNAKSIPFLQEEVAKRTIDIVMHVGDFAYNFDDVSLSFYSLCYYTRIR